MKFEPFPCFVVVLKECILLIPFPFKLLRLGPFVFTERSPVWKWQRKRCFFQVLWFSYRQIRWGRRPKWNFHLDNLASPWYFFNVAVRCSTGWITFCFRWELVVPYSPFCMWGCEVTALDFVTEICNTAKQISKALVGEVILISMSRFGKVHFYFCRMLLMLCILCAFPPLEADFYTGLSHPLKQV